MTRYPTENSSPISLKNNHDFNHQIAHANPKTSPSRQKKQHRKSNRQSSSDRPVLEKELKLKLYKEKKRLLEVKLQQHLEREALIGKNNFSSNTNINGYATVPSKQFISPPKERFLKIIL